MISVALVIFPKFHERRLDLDLGTVMFVIDHHKQLRFTEAKTPSILHAFMISVALVNFPKFHERRLDSDLGTLTYALDHHKQLRFTEAKTPSILHVLMISVRLVNPPNSMQGDWICIWGLSRRLCI